MSGAGDGDPTSAVPGMSVSEMRRHLATLRERFAGQCAADPFNINEELLPGLTYAAFAHQVAMGLHAKRFNNRARSAAARARAPS